MGPTVAEIKESLDNLGVVYKATMRKGELAALLEEHQPVEQDDHYSPPYTRRRTTMSAADIAVSQPLNPAGALLEKFDEEPESLEDEVDVKIFRESSPIKESVIEEQVTEIVTNGVDHSEENGVEENEVGEGEVIEAESSITLTNDNTQSTTTTDSTESRTDHNDSGESVPEEFVIVEKDEVDGEEVTESEVTGSSEVTQPLDTNQPPLDTIASLMEPSPIISPTHKAEDALVTESVITSVLENSPDGKIVTRSTTKRRSTRMSRHTACSAALFSDEETTAEPEEMTVEAKEITPGGQSIRKILIISILLVLLANLVAYLHINNPGLIAGHCNTVKSWFIEEPSSVPAQ